MNLSPIDPVRTATGRALVVASTPAAADVGAQILRRGGNAADAAVATVVALCVTDPANLSIAGRCHALVAEADGPIDVIDGATQVPKRLPQLGPIPIPGLPAALSLLHDRHGLLPQADLLEPAIKLARDGFLVSMEVARVWQRREPELALNAAVRRHYLIDDHAPLSKTLLCLPALAGLLEYLQTNGLSSFYQHVDVIQDGPWDVADLRNYRAHRGEESRLDLEDCQLVTTGAQAWGPVLIHLLDKLMHLADEPDPLLRMDQIAKSCAGALQGLVSSANSLTTDLDTTHLVCVDNQGLTVSLTGSIGPHFGAKKAHPTLGFLYPWSYQMVLGCAPGKRDITEMCPTILLRDGRPWLAIGAAGSERIPQAIAQCLRYRLQDALDLDQAIVAPRLAASGDRARLWRDIDHQLLSRLSRLGWQVERAGPGHIDHVGIVHAAELLGNGLVTGSADRSYDGSVVVV